MKFIHKGQELVELLTNTPAATLANVSTAAAAATSAATIQADLPSMSESAIRNNKGESAAAAATEKLSYENGTGSLLDAKKL